MVRTRNPLRITLDCWPILKFCVDGHGGTKRRYCRPLGDVLAGLVFFVNISASRSKQVSLSTDDCLVSVDAIYVEGVRDFDY